jgi:hypothetical protein
MVHF